jgi:Na+/alanine symporter
MDRLDCICKAIETGFTVSANKCTLPTVCVYCVYPALPDKVQNSWNVVHTRTEQVSFQSFWEVSYVTFAIYFFFFFFFFFFQWSSSLSEPAYYRTCAMYIRRQGGMWLKTLLKKVIFTFKTMIWMSTHDTQLRLECFKCGNTD